MLCLISFLLDQKGNKKNQDKTKLLPTGQTPGPPFCLPGAIKRGQNYFYVLLGYANW